MNNISQSPHTPEAWGAASRGYAEKIAPFLMRPFSDELVVRLNVNEYTTVLEVGADSGALTEALFPRVKSVLGRWTETIMESTQFVIEGTFEGGDGRGYVVARAVDPTAAFTLSSNSRIDGRPVEQWLDMPRALDADGRQRMDLVAFCLKHASDRPRLKTGDRVVLE